MGNDTNSWDNWTVPVEGGTWGSEQCFASDLSSIAFDVYLFGSMGYEIDVDGGHFNLLSKHGSGPIARLPLPASFEELVHWARMAAAMHGDEHE